jgi:hypothetical protein
MNLGRVAGRGSLTAAEKCRGDRKIGIETNMTLMTYCITSVTCVS